MNIVEFGADLAELVEFRLKELCLRNINCIYIDLPLSHPATQQFCASLEMLGFFFGAVIPELSNGDILRMQYLNNVEVRADEIHTATDWGRELLDYVLRARH
jgi:serine/threonine-protein kinase RsbW